jgi:hypothetical protein
LEVAVTRDYPKNPGPMKPPIETVEQKRREQEALENEIDKGSKEIDKEFDKDIEKGHPEKKP